MAGHVDALRAMIADPGGVEVLGGILSYLSEVSDTPAARLYEFMREVGPEAEEATMTTLAERLRTEGRTEGLAAGRTEGLAEGRTSMLLELMTMKFGPLSDQIRTTIAAGTDQQIRLWSTRLIEGAATPEDVIA